MDKSHIFPPPKCIPGLWGRIVRAVGYGKVPRCRKRGFLRCWGWSGAPAAAPGEGQRKEPDTRNSK